MSPPTGLPAGGRVRNRFGRHYSSLRDAVTGDPITESTRLAVLYAYTDTDGDLRNLNEISKPAVPCVLSCEDSRYPAATGRGNQEYELLIRFNRLSYAPCVRLECHLPANPAHDRPPLTLVLEFHFNLCDGKDLRGFYFEDHAPSHDSVGSRPASHDAEISFITNGATHSGFNHLEQFTDSFLEEQEAIIAALRSLHKMDGYHRVRFELKLSSLHAEDLRAMNELLSHLPGGDGEQLPSLDAPEYSAFRETSHTHLIDTPLERISREPPHPMVVLATPDAFPSMDAYVAHHGEAAKMEDMEARLVLQAWGAADHKGVIFKHNHHAILAVNSSNVRTLESSDGRHDYCLPDELNVKISFRYKSPSGREEALSLDAFLSPEALRLPPHQFYLVITSHTPRELSRKLGEEEIARASSGSARTYTHRTLDIEPHCPTFRLRSILEALILILKPEYSTLQQILLAQDLVSLRDLDMTTGTNRGKLAAAKHWALHYKEWNSEQKMIIESIHKAKGGLMLVMGPAGTGKTLLITVLAMVFAKLEGKVMILTAANANADHSIKELFDVARLHGKRAYRIYATGNDQGLQSMSEEQMRHRRNDGHHGGHSSNIDKMLFRLFSQRHHEPGSRCDIEHGVIDEADRGELHHCQRLRRLPVGQYGPVVNVWEVLKGHIDKLRGGTFNLNNNTEKFELEASYQACKRHLLQMADIVITTTGNAACGEIVEDFLDGSVYDRPGFAGIYQLFEEANKDQEINVLNGLVRGRAGLVKGRIMFGDDKQLAPVNTSAQGRVQYNCFRECSSTAMPTRLIGQGFPALRLRVQHRMRHCLARAASDLHYESSLESAPGANPPFDPELKKVLLSCMAKIRWPSNEGAREAYISAASDDDACVGYFQVVGTRESNDKRSSAVPEHVAFFGKKVLPSLMDFFKDRLNNEMMVICPYKYTKHLYEELFNDFRARDASLTDAHFPKIRTAHTAQGQEANIVWLDAAIQHRNVQGFVKESCLANVCITRAKSVLLMVGGSMSFKVFRNPRHVESPEDDFGTLVAYRELLMRQDRLHKRME